MFEAKVKIDTTASNKYYILTLSDNWNDVVYFGLVNGYWQWKVGNTWSSTGWTYNTQWNLITLDVHLSSGTFDIIINGVTVTTGCCFWDGSMTPHSVNTLYVYAGDLGQNSLTCWIDDILIRPGGRLFIAGFQDYSLAGWTLVYQWGGTVAIDANTGRWIAPSMRMDKTYANAEVSAKHTFTAQSTHAVAEARIMVSTNAANKWFYFFVNNGATYVADFYFVGGTSPAMYYQSGSTAINCGSYAAGTWYTIKLDIWLASGKCDVYVNGALKVLDGSLYDGVAGQHTVNSLYFLDGNWGQSGITGWVDDVVVTN